MTNARSMTSNAIRGIRRKKSSLCEVKVAVIGAPGVGKSGGYTSIVLNLAPFRKHRPDRAHCLRLKLKRPMLNRTFVTFQSTAQSTFVVAALFLSRWAVNAFLFPIRLHTFDEHGETITFNFPATITSVALTVILCTRFDVQLEVVGLNRL